MVSLLVGDVYGHLGWTWTRVYIYTFFFILLSFMGFLVERSMISTAISWDNALDEKIQQTSWGNANKQVN